MLGSLVLAACTAAPGPPPADGRGAIDDVVARADRAHAGVLREIGAIVSTDRPEGSRSFALCGDVADPRGVVVIDLVHAERGGDLTTRAAASAATDLLLDAGWAVEDPVTGPSGDIVVRARSGDLDLDLQVGAGLVRLTLRSSCLEAPDVVARDYADRPTTDLDLSEALP